MVSVKEALEELGYKIKTVFNIFNKNKVPQPLFKIELEPDNSKLKKNETHPIYSIKYLMHRKITVEEPHKRNMPVQCGNCQEFGHTKSYCSLRTVCVACGDLHPSSQCESAKNGLDKKCGNCGGNCGGNHTANYRGCPVFKELLKRLKERQNIPKKTPTFEKPKTNIASSGVSHTHSKNILGAPLSSGVSYANVLKTGTAETNIPQKTGGLEACIELLTLNSITMQNTLQELVRVQNQMLQIMLSG